MPRLSAAEAAKIRMSGYPQELKTMAQTLANGQEVKKCFATHSEANRFLTRWYRFRRDALMTVNDFNSMPLIDVVALGICADGSRFDAKRRDCATPIEVTWTLPAGTQPSVQPEPPIPQPIIVPKPVKSSTDSKFVNPYLEFLNEKPKERK